MTEIMVHSHLDKGFSFPGSKFNHIKSSNGAEMSTVRNNGSEQSVNEQINTTRDKSLETAACKSDVHVCEVNVTKRGDSTTKSVVQKESNISSEDYKILATKTTVINTTYNLIAKSTTREIVTTGMEHSSWSGLPNVMTEAVDKSRVIVQVLKSDLKSKSQTVNDSKSSNPENQGSHSFRDDLCKLLSKSQSSKCDVGKSGGFFPTGDTFQDISSESQESKIHTGKGRRKQSLKKYFLNGRGTKIRDLKCVCDNLRQASPSSLRYLHYVMFNSFGHCGTGLQLLETKKNINRFCGYPFKRSSEEFQKKLKCLTKIPGQMLAGIHRAIFGKTVVLNRSVMVDQLIDFLWFPRKCCEILKKYENEIKYLSEDEYAALKESALRGPVPSVVLQKLPENCIRTYTSDHVNGKYETQACQSTDEDYNMERGSGSSRTLPAFILNGPGIKLKFFSKISHNVQNIDERPIKMLHYILYGRIEPSIKDCRRNILEFNGFSDCQQEFAAERKDIIKKLNQRELFELCQILCLRAKTNSREVRIRKIFEYLKSPSKPVKKYICRRKKIPFASKSPQLSSEIPNPSVKSPSSSDCSENIFANHGWKLKDFKTICSNIECAAPSDLIELNDLLFLKTCDESDIHQKILDFTGFNFQVNSLHYDSRKTLMHYMGFCVVRKIARLLDIEDWDKISNPEDLSSTVLKFFMKKVEPDSPCSKSFLPVSSKSVPEDCYAVESSPPLSSKSVFESSSVVESSPPLSSKSVFESSSVVESSSPSSVLENSHIINPKNPKSFKSEFYQHTNQAVSHQTGKVVIQRLTTASVQTQEMCQSFESEFEKSFQDTEAESFKSNLPCVNSAEDDSTRLRDLIHHPSEQELKDLIYHLVKENLWSFTLGDLVQKVYECYPKVNLSYRESFIKAAARQMLSELRDYAVSAVKEHNF